MSVTIVKASGQLEEFNINKLIDSLVRSGAAEDVAREIALKVEREITPASHTKHIFRTAKRLLRQYSRVSDMRYSIKKAIYSLGPAGYQFEKYFAGILKEYGYSTEVDKVVRGYCVTHEVDVFARKENQYSVIECKYHSNSGNSTDVKTALYVHSRFADIQRAFLENPQGKSSAYQGWLVTNTRCSSDAIKYAECVGLRIISWRYPGRDSLEKMIENKRLYPVNILSSMTRTSLDILFSNGIFLAKEIADMEENTFLKTSGLDTHSAKSLKKEADALCLCPQDR